MPLIVNLWGTLGVSVLIGSIFGVWWKTRKARVAIFSITTILAFAPTLFNVVGIVGYVYAFYDVPALSSVCLASYYWIWRGLPNKRSQAKGVKYDSKSNQSALALKTTIILFGALLYASEFNLFAFDVYNLGYSHNLALIVTCLCILLVDDKIISLIAATCYAAFKTGLYTNYFDSFLDVGLWVGLIVGSCARLVVLLAVARRKTDGSPSNIAETSRSVTRKRLKLRR